MLLTVNYSNGVGVTIKMEAEYPKLYSRVEVIKFDHVLVKLNTKEMDKLQVKRKMKKESKKIHFFLNNFRNDSIKDQESN